MADNILKGVIKIEAPGVQQTVSDVTQNLNTLSNNVGLAATKVSDHMKKAGMATFLARDAVLDLGHVARDLPYAASNFAILAGPIGKISSLMSTITQETGSFKGALGALGGALTGGGGLVIGLELAISAFTLLGASLFDSSNDVDRFQLEMDALNEKLKNTKTELAEVAAALAFSNQLGALNVKIAGLGDLTNLREQSIATADALGIAAGKVDNLNKQRSDIQYKIDIATDPKEVENLKKELDAVNETFETADKDRQKLEQTSRLIFREIQLQKQNDAADAEKEREKNAKEAARKRKAELAELERLEREHLAHMKELRTQQIIFQRPDQFNFGVAGDIYKNNAFFEQKLKETLGQSPKDEIKVPVLPEFKDDGQWAKGFSKMLKDGDIKKSLDELTKQLEKIIESGLSNITVDIGKSIGDAISGQGNFSDAFKGVFSELGSMIEQLGEAIIQYGIAKEVALKAIETLSPGAAIAAGVGLVILGEVIKSSLSKPQKFAQGGFVPGVGDQDSVPALLMPGEYVIPKNKVAEVMGALARSTGASFNGFAAGLNSSIKPTINGFAPSGIRLDVGGSFEMQGDRLVAVIRRTEQRQNRSF